MKNLTYFSRETSITNEQKKEILNKIKEKLPDTDVVEFNIPTSPYTEINKEVWLNKNYFFPLIDKCDNFIYILPCTKNGDTKKGSKKIGVRAELSHAIEQNKEIFKINKELSIDKMDINTFNIIYNNNKKYRNEWILKTTDDYRKWYSNNIEAVKLIQSQFIEFNVNNKKAMQAVIPQKNTLWSSNEFKKECVLKYCNVHHKQHSIIDLSRQGLSFLCPYEETAETKFSYGKRKLDNINELEIKNLILSSRVIHKLFWILEEEAFKPYGFCLKDEKGNLILRKDGKEIANENLIIGSEPVFDIDIKKEVKNNGGSFFDKNIFDEYTKVIESLKIFIENEMFGIDYKIGFSGNGIYFILQPIIFEEFDTNLSTFDEQWRIWISDFQNIINNKGIKNIHMENMYGWGRFFKAIGTFHASKERVSIPLNKDEVLNYKWIKEITNIQLGLEQNIFNEVINKAGNSW